MKKIKYIIFLIVFLLSLISSIVLSFVSIEQACGSDSNGCYQVQTSEYEKTLGIPNSYIGLFTFTILSILTILQLKKQNPTRKILIHLGVLATFVYSLYFIYLQLFVIKAVCKYCVLIDLGAIVNFISIFAFNRK